MKIKLSYEKEILFSVGLSLIVYFLWFRFIKERLPKALPLALNNITQIMLICTCLMFIYMLFRFIKPKYPSEFSIFILGFLEKFYLPFTIVDDTLKNTTWGDIIFSKILKYFQKKVSFYDTTDKIYILYKIFYLIPRVFIAFIFFLDVFYFSKFYLIYKFSFFVMILLIVKYIIYSIEKILNNLIEYLDSNYLVEIVSNDDDDFFIPLDQIEWYNDFVENMSLDEVILSPHFKYLTINKFLKLQAAAITFKHSLYEYRGVIKNTFRSTHKVFSLENFHQFMPLIIHLQVFLDNYKAMLNIYDQIKWFNIFLLLNYIICWFYILYISFDINLLNFIFINLCDINEPFSGLNLF